MSEEDFNISTYGDDTGNPYTSVKAVRDIPPTVKKYISHLTTTRSGVEFFRWLMLECGYQQSVIDVNAKTGEPILTRLFGNAALLQLWLDVRKNIPRDSLIQIEIPPEEEQ